MTGTEAVHAFVQKKNRFDPPYAGEHRQLMHCQYVMNRFRNLLEAAVKQEHGVGLTRLGNIPLGPQSQSIVDEMMSWDSRCIDIKGSPLAN